MSKKAKSGPAPTEAQKAETRLNLVRDAMRFPVAKIAVSRRTVCRSASKPPALIPWL